MLMREESLYLSDCRRLAFTDMSIVFIQRGIVRHVASAITYVIHSPIPDPIHVYPMFLYAIYQVPVPSIYHRNLMNRKK